MWKTLILTFNIMKSAILDVNECDREEFNYYQPDYPPTVVRHLNSQQHGEHNTVQDYEVELQ